MKASGLRWLWVSLLVMVLDRLSKYVLVSHLPLFSTWTLLPVLDFTLVYNTGAAFSFLHQASGWQNVFLGWLAGLVSILILIWLSRIKAQAVWQSLALCLILGGALGNAWDRLLYGYVIDFISLHWGDWHFAIFNLADSAITIGAGMLLWHWLRYN